MKIGFVSLGCCKNLVDSEQIMSMIKRGGHEIVANPKDAQAIIVNTCGFIESAKEESINTIFKMAKYKERNLEKLIVCGCLAQRYTDTLREEIPEIDAVIPIREYDTLASQLQKLLGSDTLLDKAERVITGNPWQAYVKISDGCSNRCAYCAIPLIRGDQKSRTIEDIMEEVNYLASIGVKELTLIAQDTTKYGLDNYGKLMLPELLRQVSKVEGLHWIRVLYMYPDEIVDDVLQAMSESEKIVPYFDIPMQHANNRLLKLMNRRGPKEDVLKVVDELEDKPDFIVLDPPRDGIHPKAIQKIIDFGVEQMVYISCKPTSLARDLEVFEAAGYKVKRATAVDQFPNTVHIESMVLIQKDNI